MKKIYTEEEIQVIAKSVIGKTFKDLQNLKVNTYTNEDFDEDGGDFGKAYFGHLLETNAYNLEINSSPTADFEEAGIELKVTPYKINKNKTLSAKERLVLNIINYMDEYKNSFSSSKFWNKNKKIQIIWYLYDPALSKPNYKITHELLFTFPEEDIPIIINDWETIINKIRAGKAHEISEADTMYLGACTKGANRNSVREQPFSDIKAMQRAFSLKSSYMTSLVRKYIGDYSDVEKVLKNNEVSFEEFINNVINKHIGKSRTQLIKEFNLNSTAKNLNGIIVSRMFDVKSRLRNTDEFLKANIIPRTIRVEENNRIIESFPFPYFKFNEIYEGTWEKSKLKEKLETTKYMFFIFKKKNNDYIFKGIKLWNMPEQTLETEVKDVWLKTKEVISSGNIVKNLSSSGKRITNFPGQSKNNVCHVRPHARNSKDTDSLPIPDNLTGLAEYTKQSFWINNSYLHEILKNFL